MAKPVYVGETNQAILSGEEDLSVWSEEELIRGQRRDKHGRWSGRPPKVIPKAIHDELVKRKMSQAYGLLRESIYDAVAVLVDVAQDEEADATVRLKAAEMILDRTMGKPTETMQLEVKNRFQEVFEEVVVYDDSDVIDAELVDDDD